MKPKIIIAFACGLIFLLPLLVRPQTAPQLINYQGRLSNAVGQPLDGVTVNLTFAFYGAESGGTVFLSVLQNNVQVTGGLYNLLIGSGTITPGTETALANVFKNHPNVWMGVKINNDPEMTPRARIASVPYALHASYAASCDLSALITAAWNDPDQDQDGYTSSFIGGPDCNDADPMVYPGATEICDGIDNQCPDDPGFGLWDEGCPGACNDLDADGEYDKSHCGSPVDCNDNDPNNWDSCFSCADADLDLYFDGCDAYITIDGPDCDDFDPNNWTACATCLDFDADTYFAGCDGYLTIAGPDCGDTIASIHPSAPELCDTVDNQCPGDPGYGAVDEGCTIQKLGGDIRISFGVNDSVVPGSVWTGSEFGLIWNDNRNGNDEIYFARVSGSGARIGTEIRLTQSSGSSRSEVKPLTWTGSEYGAAWYDDRDGNWEIYFARIAADGVKIGGDVRITNHSAAQIRPSVEWSGSEFGLAWEVSVSIEFVRVSSEGVKIGTESTVSSFSSQESVPFLAWTGSEYGVAWELLNGFWDIYFARIAADGVKLGLDVGIASGSGHHKLPSLVWTGSEFGLSHSFAGFVYTTPDAYFIRISDLGEKIGDNVAITSTDNNSWDSLAWTGSEYGLAFYSFRDGNNEIYFARISAAGSKIGDDLRITSDSNDSMAPSLVWTGSQFGMSWYDHRDGNHEIYFARIGTGP